MTLTGADGTKENEIIVIRQFLKYMNLNGYKAFIPQIPKVHDNYSPYIFSDTELAMIFKSADNITIRNKTACKYIAIEFPVILRLLFSCGLRIGETIRIQMKDVDLKNGVLRLLNTKGDKHRLVPMSEMMTNILARYCWALGIVGDEQAWLFPGNDEGTHISNESVKNRFKWILKDNGIELKNRKKHERGPCMHCMRHVFAFKSFKQTEKLGISMTDSVPFLSIYLGHDSLNETEKYLKFSSEMYPETTEVFGSFMKDLLPEVDYET
ncbi:MAG: tyrosine-type recombinase/integrase [Eubacterium sp.]|nr:tyrosine-type recombinase/integrase [Eubacterium sp.]